MVIIQLPQIYMLALGDLTVNHIFSSSFCISSAASFKKVNTSITYHENLRFGATSPRASVFQFLVSVVKLSVNLFISLKTTTKEMNTGEVRDMSCQSSKRRGSV